MRLGWVLVGCLVLSPCLGGEAQAQNPPNRQVERDALGRRSGTVERTPDGRQLHRDELGRRSFSTERRPNGDLIYRDPHNRRIDPPRPQERRR